MRCRSIGGTLSGQMNFGLNQALLGSHTKKRPGGPFKALLGRGEGG